MYLPIRLEISQKGKADEAFGSAFKKRRGKSKPFDLVRIDIIDEPLSLYVSRVRGLLDEEIRQRIASGKKQGSGYGTMSISLPSIIGKVAVQYSGMGQFDCFDLGLYESIYRVGQIDNAKVEGYAKKVGADFVKKMNCVYPCGMLSFEVRDGAGFVQWQIGEVRTERQLSESETLEGLMRAVEQFGSTGEVDPLYSIFLKAPFSLSVEDLSIKHRGRLLAEDLGV